MKATRNAMTLTILVFATMTAFLAPSAWAEVPEGEVLYLANTHNGAHASDSHSHLYRVRIDEAGDFADLEEVPGGALPYNEIEAIAGTPDGLRVYFFDTYRTWVGPSDPLYGTGLMGYYDVLTGGVVEIDYLRFNGNVLPEVVMAAFSPAGDLYLGSQLTNNLYTADPDTGVATLVGPIKRGSAAVDLFGADIAFAADGTLYLWTNQGAAGAPAGLYRLSLPAAPGPIAATYVGAGGAQGQGDFFTGLAIRANGFGEIVGSSTEPFNEIHVQEKATSFDVGTSPFAMLEDGVPVDYRYGDMANGRLGGFCTRTIGYWKNHDWPTGVTIAGVPVDQAYGQTILDGASAKNFSMLIAQLIAAKLNTGNATGLGFIDAAEQWLTAQGVVLPSNTLDWTKVFATKDQKTTANSFKDPLDLFNNENHCN